MAPAQFEGDAEVTGVSWVLLVFRDGAQANVTTAAVEYVNHTQVRLRSTLPLAFDVPRSVSAQRTSLAAVEAGLAFPAWGSLLVVADDIRVASYGSGEIIAFDGNASAARGFISSLPPGVFRDGAIDAGREAGLWLHGDAVFSLDARGVRVAEWHGAAVTCGNQDCPDGGGSFTAHPGGGHVRAEMHSYTRLEGRGAVHAGGVLHGVVAGGDGFRFDLDGVVRLPGADASPDCDCYDPESRTATLEGDLTLDGVRRSGGGLSAVVGGDTASARVDESDVTEAFHGPGLAVGAGVGLALIGVALVLFSRFHRHNVLEHPVRSEVHAAVARSPGVGLETVARAAGVSRGTARHHVARLEDTGILVSRRHGHRRRLYLAGAAPAGSLAGDRDARSLLDWMRVVGPVRQRDVVAWGRLRDWGRSKCQDVAQRLVSAGLVKSWKQSGRWYVVPGRR